jgi:hypothetical protein
MAGVCGERDVCACINDEWDGWMESDAMNRSETKMSFGVPFSFAYLDHNYKYPS